MARKSDLVEGETKTDNCSRSKAQIGGIELCVNYQPEEKSEEDRRCVE